MIRPNRVLNGFARPALSQEDIDQAKQVFDIIKGGEEWSRSLPVAIVLIAKGSLPEAIPMIENFVKNRNPDVRAEALQALILVYHLPEHCRTAWAMLEDKDIEPRRIATSCIGFCFSGSKDINVLQRLAIIVKNEDENQSVRETAYNSILDVLNCPYLHPKRLALRVGDFIESVDWDMIDTIQQGKTPTTSWESP